MTGDFAWRVWHPVRVLPFLLPVSAAIAQTDPSALQWLQRIYAASEKPIPGVSACDLAERLRAYGHRSVHYAGSIDSAVEAVAGEVQPGDLVMTLGAGNVWQAGDRLLERLREGTNAA